jgi:hypothetical protein
MNEAIPTGPEAKDKIAAALARAQQEFKPLHKNRTAKVQMKNGGTYSYNYADLSDVFESCRTALGKNDLAVTQNVIVDHLQTDLWHASGQFLRNSVPLNAGQAITPQMFGSALTYARRYGLTALLGIVADDDDDAGGATMSQKTAGNAIPGKAAASNTPINTPNPRQVSLEIAKNSSVVTQVRPTQADYPRANPNWKNEPATEAQVKRLHALGKECNFTHEDLKVLAEEIFPEVVHLENLSKGQIQVLFNELEGPKGSGRNNL